MSRQMRTALDMAGNPIDNVANPTDPQDAATKAYVDLVNVNEVSVGNTQPVDGSELWVDMSI